MKIKRIAVLTSGGDAPGMNTAIYGVYRACVANKITPFAVMEGYNGLIDNKFVRLDFAMLNGNIDRGGSVIKSSRSPKFLKAVYFKKAIKNLQENKIDALIIIGGDGSIKGAMELRDAGVKVITLPATIDNDLNFTFTIGYDTATNNIVNAVDNITDSLSSFDYGAVVRIMGRDCPALVESVACALHTDFVITKKDFDLNNLVKKIKASHNSDNLPPVVLVLEDVVDTTVLASILQEKCKFQWRPHILGYIQRGGSPSAFDRKYGYTAGVKAVEMIISGQTGLSVGMIGNSLETKSLEDTIL
ncbi:MAG: ATP-dependent 6-phosphofructokinase [Clostridia bacterium]|nr:ATP-dependent 6-phosphofructokinase [Clostridia bacterium]